MSKLKICVTITTRGNYAKLKSVIENINHKPEMELSIIAGGGAILDKYGNIIDALADSIKTPVKHIHFLVAGEKPVTMAKSAGLAITEFSSAFENIQPDIVLVVGDRFESLPITIAAAYMNIPVAHLEGGEVSGNIDESIRHAITKLSHIHFPATQKAAERIIKLGEDPETVHPVGCTSLDVIKNLKLNELGPVMNAQQISGVGPVINLTETYLVVIQHPVTTEYDENLAHINETIRAISSLRINTIWIWPNMDAGSDGTSKGIRIFREQENPDFVHFFKSLPIELYAPLLANAACIIGNSSSGIRESGFLGVPSVNIGSRQNQRERANNVINCSYDASSIVDAIRLQLEHGKFERDFLYGDGNSGEKIVRILASHQINLQKQITY